MKLLSAMNEYISSRRLPPVASFFFFINAVWADDGTSCIDLGQEATRHEQLCPISSGILIGQIHLHSARCDSEENNNPVPLNMSNEFQRTIDQTLRRICNTKTRCNQSEIHNIGSSGWKAVSFKYDCEIVWTGAEEVMDMALDQTRSVHTHYTNLGLLYEPKQHKSGNVGRECSLQGDKHTEQEFCFTFLYLDLLPSNCGELRIYSDQKNLSFTCKSTQTQHKFFDAAHGDDYDIISKRVSIKFKYTGVVWIKVKAKNKFTVKCSSMTDKSFMKSIQTSGTSVKTTLSHTILRSTTESSTSVGERGKRGEGDGDHDWNETIIAVVTAVAACAIIISVVLAVCLMRRRRKSEDTGHSRSPYDDQEHKHTADLGDHDYMEISPEYSQANQPSLWPAVSAARPRTSAPTAQAVDTYDKFERPGTASRTAVPGGNNYDTTASAMEEYSHLNSSANTHHIIGNIYDG